MKCIKEILLEEQRRFSSIKDKEYNVDCEISANCYDNNGKPISIKLPGTKRCTDWKHIIEQPYLYKYLCGPCYYEEIRVKKTIYTETKCEDCKGNNNGCPSDGNEFIEVQMAPLCNEPLFGQHITVGPCTEYIDETWASSFRCKLVLLGRLVTPGRAVGYESQINGTIRLINPTSTWSGIITVINGQFRLLLVDLDRSSNYDDQTVGPFEVLSSNLTGPDGPVKFAIYSKGKAGTPITDWMPDARILVGLPTPLIYHITKSSRMPSHTYSDYWNSPQHGLPSGPRIEPYSVLSVAPAGGEPESRIVVQTITDEFGGSGYPSYSCGIDMVGNLYSRSLAYDIGRVSGTMTVRLANGALTNVSVADGRYAISKLIAASRLFNSNTQHNYGPVVVTWSNLIHTADDGKRTQLFFPNYHPNQIGPINQDGTYTRDNTIIGWNDIRSEAEILKMNCLCRNWPNCQS